VSEIVASAAPPTVDPRLRELRRVAIVPALNEEHSIGRVIDELRAFDPGLDIVVVDDGSLDATSYVAAAKGARVLRLPFNLGIGGAVQTGFRYAFEHDYDVAVRVDGDGQHDPAQLGRVLDPVLLLHGKIRNAVDIEQDLPERPRQDVKHVAMLSLCVPHFLEDVRAQVSDEATRKEMYWFSVKRRLAEKANALLPRVLVLV